MLDFACLSVAFWSFRLSKRAVHGWWWESPIHETCLVLRGRLRSLREAGFRVMLISSPGELLDQSGRQRRCGFVCDSDAAPYFAAFRSGLAVSALAVSARVAAGRGGVQHAQGRVLGTVAARLCGVPRRIYLLRGLKLETTTGIKRRICWPLRSWPRACAHVVLCNSGSLRDQAVALGVAPAEKLMLLGCGSSRGVDMEEFAPGASNVRQRYGLPAGSESGGFCGAVDAR